MGIQAKVITLVVMLLISGGGIWRYNHVVNERDQLLLDVKVYEANEQILKDALALERDAAAVAMQERNDTQAALDKLRKGREDDPEAVQWGAEVIPAGEINRLCMALPEMEGCLNTTLAN